MAASLVSTASKKGGVGSLDKAAMLGFDLSVCELQASQVARMSAASANDTCAMCLTADVSVGGSVFLQGRHKQTTNKHQ
jgi:hypothetical protein